MRPKKTILCVDVDEFRLSQRAFVLETRGYHILRAGAAEAALERMRQRLPFALDLVLIHAPLPDCLTLLRQAKVLYPFTPTMVTSDFSGYDSNLSIADAYLPKGSWGTAELNEHVKILVTRKRGPRPLDRKLPVGAERAIAAADRRSA